MGRYPKSKHELKNKCVKINITELEYERFNNHKNRLLEYSPALSANDLLRLVIANIDDLSLIEFLQLDKRHPIKILLLNNFLLTHVKK